MYNHSKNIKCANKNVTEMIRRRPSSISKHTKLKVVMSTKNKIMRAC